MWPSAYRLSQSRVHLPDGGGLVLGAVDGRTPCGKRGYAILLPLVTYGLRAREVRP